MTLVMTFDIPKNAWPTNVPYESHHISHTGVLGLRMRPLVIVTGLLVDTFTVFPWPKPIAR